MKTFTCMLLIVDVYNDAMQGSTRSTLLLNVLSLQLINSECIITVNGLVNVDYIKLFNLKTTDLESFTASSLNYFRL